MFNVSFKCEHASYQTQHYFQRQDVISSLCYYGVTGYVREIPEGLEHPLCGSQYVIISEFRVTPADINILTIHLMAVFMILC